MDELQQVLMMVRKYFPAATIEEVEPIYAKVKESDPNITVDQIEKLMQQMIPKIQQDMGARAGKEVSDKDAKMAALEAMRG